MAHRLVGHRLASLGCGAQYLEERPRSDSITGTRPYAAGWRGCPQVGEKLRAKCSGSGFSFSVGPSWGPSGGGLRATGRFVAPHESILRAWHIDFAGALVEGRDEPSVR